MWMLGHRQRSGLIAVAAIAMLTGTAAHAQNLDEGKSPAALFDNGCSACHRSPRGLAKGRFRLTLFAFLQQHLRHQFLEASAWALSAYLEDTEGPSPTRPRGHAPKPSHRATRPDGDPVVRPPAPVR